MKGPRLTAVAKAGNSNTHWFKENIYAFYLSVCYLDGDLRLQGSIRGVSLAVGCRISRSSQISGE